MAGEKIYIFDAFLSSPHGHCLLEALALRDAIEKKHVECEIWGTTRLDRKIAKENKIFRKLYENFTRPALLFRVLQKIQKKIPACSNFIDKYFQRVFLSHVGCAKKIITGFVKELPLDGNFYLFKTCSSDIIKHVLTAVCEHDLNIKVAFSSHYYMNQSEIAEIKKLADRLAVPPLFFWSSEIHVMKYKEMGFESAGILPIPQGAWNINPDTDNNEKDVINIVFLGLSIPEKGFLLLPELIRRIKEVFPRGKIDFTIQYSNILDNIEIKEAYNELLGMEVNLPAGPLDNSAYYKILDDSDIVLLPYQVTMNSPHYARGGTSGVLVEALARGKVAVVPGDSWLSLQVEKFNSGKCFYGNDDFYKKTIDAINEYDILKTRAERNKEYWQTLHSPENVSNIILKCLK